MWNGVYLILAEFPLNLLSETRILHSQPANFQKFTVTYCIIYNLFQRDFEKVNISNICFDE